MKPPPPPPPSAAAVTTLMKQNVMTEAGPLVPNKHRPVAGKFSPPHFHSQNTNNNNISSNYVNVKRKYDTSKYKYISKEAKNLDKVREESSSIVKE